MSVERATSTAARRHWPRHQPTGPAAGRLHTITLMRANLVLWHMRIPLPWHLHLCLRMIAPLPCHQTRLCDARLFPFSFASGPEIGTTCALQAPPAIRFDVSLIATFSVVLQLPHTLTCKDYTRFYHDTVTTATSAERKGFHSRLPYLLCISARYTRLFTCSGRIGLNTHFPASNTSHYLPLQP